MFFRLSPYVLDCPHIPPWDLDQQLHAKFQANWSSIVRAIVMFSIIMTLPIDWALINVLKYSTYKQQIQLLFNYPFIQCLTAKLNSKFSMFLKIAPDFMDAKFSGDLAKNLGLVCKSMLLKKSNIAENFSRQKEIKVCGMSRSWAKESMRIKAIWSEFHVSVLYSLLCT